MCNAYGLIAKLKPAKLFYIMANWISKRNAQIHCKFHEIKIVSSMNSKLFAAEHKSEIYIKEEFLVTWCTLLHIMCGWAWWWNLKFKWKKSFRFLLLNISHFVTLILRIMWSNVLLIFHNTIVSTYFPYSNNVAQFQQNEAISKEADSEIIEFFVIKYWTL